MAYCVGGLGVRGGSTTHLKSKRPGIALVSCRCDPSIFRISGIFLCRSQ